MIALLPEIPDSLERCRDAMSVANRLISQIQSEDTYTAENHRWIKANVGAIELFDIEFTEEETKFFDQCLSLLSDKITD